MRLLLVEDDVSIQQFVKRALVDAGYQADTAGNANKPERPWPWKAFTMPSSSILAFPTWMDWT
jgi:DNA-binding NtrC family response regulator